MATINSQWHGWGWSLVLHACLAVALFGLWPVHRPDPILFKWEVNVVQPPPAAEAAPASEPHAESQPAKTSVESAVSDRAMNQPARDRPTVWERPQAMEKAIVQRAPEQSRPVHQRTARMAEPGLTTNPSPIEHARAMPATQQRTPMETKTVEAMPSAKEMQAAAQTPPSAVSRMAAHTAQPSQIEEGEVVQRGASASTPSRRQEIAEAVTAQAVREVSPVEQVTRQTEARQTETSQSEPVPVRQSRPAGGAARSSREVRAHYGWLKADLMAHIERLKRYPQFALDNKWEGRVVVRAVIWADGRLTDLSVVETSGHDLLDREALELLKRISPVSLKHELVPSPVTLRIPINYGIR
ncbi:MAG: energy transducer TonB [Nitrospira sp.]